MQQYKIISHNKDEINKICLKPIKEIVDYIKNSLDIIIKLKFDKAVEDFKKNYQNLSEGIEYEKLLQKEEEQIRKISRIELILKIQCEKYAQRIDVLERYIKILKMNLVIKYIL